MSDDLIIHNHVEGAHYVLEHNPPRALVHLIAGSVGMDDIAKQMQKEIKPALDDTDKMNQFFERWHPFIDECVRCFEDNFTPRTISREAHLESIDDNPMLSKLINEELTRKIKQGNTEEVKTQKHALRLDLFNTFTDENLYVARGGELKTTLTSALMISQAKATEKFVDNIIKPLDNITEGAREKLSGTINPQNILTLLEFEQITIDDIIHTMREEYQNSSDMGDFVSRWHPLIETFSLLTQKNVTLLPPVTNKLLNLDVTPSPMTNAILRENANVVTPLAPDTMTPSRISVGLEITFMHCLAEEETANHEMATAKAYTEKALATYFKEKYSDVDPASTTILNVPHNQKTLH